MIFTFRVTPTDANLITGSERLVDRLLTIVDPQAARDTSARLKLWDGLIHFYDREKKTFPQGLLSKLTKRLEKRGHAVEVIWDPQAPTIPPVTADYLIGIEMAGAYAFQLDAVNAGLSHHRGLWWLATNAGKASCIAAFTGSIARAGYSAVVIVPNKFLVHQTSNDIQKYLGPDVKVGIVGDGIRNLKCQILVGTYQSLIKGVSIRAGNALDEEIESFLYHAAAIVVDEGHHAGGAGGGGAYQDLLAACATATYRIACSGSFDKTDKSLERSDKLNATAVAHQWRTEASFGPVLARIRNDDLVASGISAKPTILLVDDSHAFGPPVATPCPPPEALAHGKRFNRYRPVFEACCIKDKTFRRAVTRVVECMLAQGKPPFVFSHSVIQLKRLEKTLKHFKVPCVMLSGRDPMSTRNQVLREFKTRQDFALLATSIFDEGASIPEIRGVVLAGARKSPIELLQRIGRAVRKKKTGTNTVVVVDFAMLSNQMLNKHYRTRIASYRDEKFAIKRMGSLANLASFPF